MSPLRDSVIAITAGRDRVLDAIKTVALVLVIVGHSLAWHTTAAGAAVNVLEVSDGLIVLTWVFQVLPLFFAAGAISNLASLEHHGRTDYLRARVTRLLGPVLVYSAVFTAVLLPWHGNPTVVSAGRFLSQLLWFAAVYLAVVTAVPLTARWRPQPVVSLTLWLTAIAAVDYLRVLGVGVAGWLNLLLVWGWLHQLGYYLPRLRTYGIRAVIGGGLFVGTAAALALRGPYSSSLVSVAGDPELSNLAPPSLVLLLFGVGQILIVAGLWPLLDKWLRNDRLWLPIAVVGARAMDMYLWHIPVVGLSAGLMLAIGWSQPPLSAAWWAVHVSVALIALSVAWVMAGVVDPAQRWLAHVRPSPPRRMPATAGVVGALAVLHLSVAGFATWRGGGALGLPASAPVLVLLIFAAYCLADGRRPARPADRDTPTTLSR